MTPTSNIQSMMEQRDNARQVRLVCRKGFGYVLVAEDPGTLYIKPGTVFVYKTGDWARMQLKIRQAEALFEVACEYEGDFDAHEDS